MVRSPDPERRATAVYSGLRVRELAKQGRVHYGSRRVQLDVENLGYAPEDVHRCLQVLNDCHFKHAERYAAAGPWFDVYLVPYSGPNGVVDDLYVKLKLDRDCVVVVLASFQRER
jgi:motility quorum-sensing regulator/GCU-specific mRNA interferase toxin